MESKTEGLTFDGYDVRAGGYISFRFRVPGSELRCAADIATRVQALARQFEAAPEMLEALKAYEAVGPAHDALSDAIEDPDGGNDAEHDAAVALLDALNEAHEMRLRAIAHAEGR